MYTAEIEVLHLSQVQIGGAEYKGQAFKCQEEQGRSVQLFSGVRLFATPWTTARQACLSITNSWSLLKLTSIESVLPSNHLVLFSLSPPSFNQSQHHGIFK